MEFFGTPCTLKSIDTCSATSVSWSLLGKTLFSHLSSATWNRLWHKSPANEAEIGVTLVRPEPTQARLGECSISSYRKDKSGHSAITFTTDSSSPPPQFISSHHYYYYLHSGHLTITKIRKYEEPGLLHNIQSKISK